MWRQWRRRGERRQLVPPIHPGGHLVGLQAADRRAGPRERPAPDDTPCGCRRARLGHGPQGVSYEYVLDVNGAPLHISGVATVDLQVSAADIGAANREVFNPGSHFAIRHAHPNGAITNFAKFLFVFDNGVRSAWTELQNANGTFGRPVDALTRLDDSSPLFTDFSFNNLGVPRNAVTAQPRARLLRPRPVRACRPCRARRPVRCVQGAHAAQRAAAPCVLPQRALQQPEGRGHVCDAPALRDAEVDDVIAS